MPILSLSDLRFANLALTGEKNQSIRPDTKHWRKVKVGDSLHLIFKAQAPPASKPKDYRSNTIHRLTPQDNPAVCVGNLPIIIGKNEKYDFVHIQQKDNGMAPYSLSIDTLLANDRYGALFMDDLFRLDKFAKMDGFESWEEMKKYFLKDRERFNGRLIMWEPLELEPIKQYCYTCGRIRPIHLMEQVGDKYECLDKSCGGEILEYKRR